MLRLYQKSGILSNQRGVSCPVRGLRAVTADGGGELPLFGVLIGLKIGGFRGAATNKLGTNVPHRFDGVGPFFLCLLIRQEGQKLWVKLTVRTAHDTMLSAWYISAPLGEATKKKSSIYSLPLCKPLQGRFPAGWYPGIGRGGKSVYTAFWVAQGAGMKSRGGKAGGGDFAQAKYYPFTP